MSSAEDQLRWAFRTWKDIMRSENHHASIKALIEEHEAMLHEQVRQRVKAALERRFMFSEKDKKMWAFRTWKDIMREFDRKHHVEALKKLQESHDAAFKDKMRENVRLAIERQLRLSSRGRLVWGFRRWVEVAIALGVKNKLAASNDAALVLLRDQYEELLVMQRKELTAQFTGDLNTRVLRLDRENGLYIDSMRTQFEREKNELQLKEKAMFEELKRLEALYKLEVDEKKEVMRKNDEIIDSKVAEITSKYMNKLKESLATQKEEFEMEKSHLQLAIQQLMEKNREIENDLRSAFELEFEVALNERETQCYDAFEKEKQHMLAEFNKRLHDSYFERFPKRELERLASPKKYESPEFREHKRSPIEHVFMNSTMLPRKSPRELKAL
jgi:hypothetical protein